MNYRDQLVKLVRSKNDAELEQAWKDAMLELLQHTGTDFHAEKLRVDHTADKMKLPSGFRPEDQVRVLTGGSSWLPDCRMWSVRKASYTQLVCQQVRPGFFLLTQAGKLVGSSVRQSAYCFFSFFDTQVGWFLIFKVK